AGDVPARDLDPRRSDPLHGHAKQAAVGQHDRASISADAPELTLPLGGRDDQDRFPWVVPRPKPALPPGSWGQANRTLGHGAGPRGAIGSGRGAHSRMAVEGPLYTGRA